MTLPVEPAQVTPAGAHRPVHAIAGGVLFIIGVRGGNEWHPQLPGNLDAGYAKRELGRYVNYIRAEPGRVFDYIAQPRKSPLHVGVQKQRNAGRTVHFGTVCLSPPQRVTGRVDPDLMSALLQGPGEAQERNPHAAHHGPINLGKQGDPHEITLEPRCAGDKAGPAIGHWLPGVC
jgi:hypothetical protein